jgi:hypothetical protein
MVRILLGATLTTTSLVSSASSFELRPRAGGGLKPDGVVVGIQATVDFRGSELLRFAPSVDVGRGRGSTATAYNLDLLLGPLEVSKTPLGLYGGVGHTFLSIEGGVREGNTAVVGACWGEYFLAETRIGFDKAPDLRLLVGVRLRRE